jgi:hypothetical protein
MTLNEYKDSCEKFYRIYISAFVPLGLVNVLLINYLIFGSSDYIATFGHFIDHQFGDNTGGAIFGAIAGLMIGVVSIFVVFIPMIFLKQLIGVKCPSCGALLVNKNYYEYVLKNYRCLRCKGLIITQTSNQSSASRSMDVKRDKEQRNEE